MAVILSNAVEINYHPEFQGRDLLEIKIIYKVDRVEENLGEFLLTKEAALELAEDIMRHFKIS
ncbi:MAG: hypothetical protein WCJ58_00975 [bacterium]